MEPDSDEVSMSAEEKDMLKLPDQHKKAKKKFPYVQRDCKNNPSPTLHPQQPLIVTGNDQLPSAEVVAFAFSPTSLYSWVTCPHQTLNDRVRRSGSASAATTYASITKSHRTSNAMWSSSTRLAFPRSLSVPISVKSFLQRAVSSFTWWTFRTCHRTALFPSALSLRFPLSSGTNNGPH